MLIFVARKSKKIIEILLKKKDTYLNA